MISPTPERTWLGLGLGLGSALGLGPRLGLGLGSGVGLGLGLAGTHVRGLEGPEEVGVDEGVQRREEVAHAWRHTVAGWTYAVAAGYAEGGREGGREGG